MKTIGWVLCGLLYLFSCAAHARAPMEPVTGEPEAEVFTLDAIDGTSVRLDDYRGKFVLLNFWATWCAPCRKEMPALDRLHKKLNNGGFEVIGIHVGPSLSGVKKFLDQVPVEFTILIDQNMELSNWGVLGLPTTFLISPEGKFIYRAVGEREWNSAKMVRFLTKVMSTHQRLVQDKVPAPARNTSFLGNLKESLGWNSEKRKEHQLLSN